MNNENIVINLNALLRQIEAMFPTIHNEYKVTRTRAIATKGIKYLEEYDPMGIAILEESKNNSIKQLQQAIHYADKYYQEGWDESTRTNNLVQDELFLLPASQGIYSFIEEHKSKLTIKAPDIITRLKQWQVKNEAW